jgi:TetR/AcrR family transcriptional regulator, regulator of autoinduction and epiphytic fitness
VTATLPDRRAATKARYRAAILEAASALVDERGGPRFTIDELADRADVARRTVFNHFASSDEVLLALCTERLLVIVDQFLATVSTTPVGDGSRSSMFDELAAALDATDIPTAIAVVVRIIGGPGALVDRTSVLPIAALARVGDRLVQEVFRRYPAADALDAELLVGGLVEGLTVIAAHWADRTGAVVDDASRAEWRRLLARLVSNIRSGYMPA